MTMALGGIGYCIYSASFLCYNHTQNEGFVIFSGTLLGICGAFLWCAQGVVMMVSQVPIPLRGLSVARFKY